MLERIRPRSAYDVMAAIALFVAIGTGGAYAANTVGSSDIIDNSVASVDLKDGDIKAVDIGVGQVLGSRIVDETVKTEDLADNRVATADLKDGDVRSIDLASGAVATSDLADGAVTTGKVQDDGLTGADIEESSLGTVPQADRLDGFDSTRFARIGGFVFGDGTIQQGTGFTVTRLSEGHYQVLFPSGTLGGLCPPVAVVQVFHGIDGSSRHAELSGNGCSGGGAGNFSVKTFDSAGVVHDTAFTFIVM